MQAPDWLHFFRRTFPSANMVLIKGARPILIDTGFGSDVAETEALLRAAGTPPEQLALIVNTHYHSDHVGGNSRLQQHYGLPIAAHARDADLVNRRDGAACAALWLDQPIEPYRVTQVLNDGDIIDAGGIALHVLHTPGHALGQISLYAPEEQVLVCGDTVHSDDVAWINLFQEGEHALQRAMQSIERVARLPVRWACSGHGPPMIDPPAAFATALQRYRKWQEDPEKLGWHAVKRIMAYQLMLHDGMSHEEFTDYVLQRAWFEDYSRHVFRVEPADFVQPLIDELVRSRAASWQDDHLVALTPYTPPPPGWPEGPARPPLWPR